MDIRWAVILSWHAVKSSDVIVTTLCGRVVGSAEHVNVVDTLPAGRSCEVCLRIVARRVDT